MKNFLENYNKFKENRRAVGFSKLGFWVLFFGMIIFIAIFSGKGNSSTIPSKEEKKEEPIENKEEINSYDFEYIFNDKKYSGTFYNYEMEIIGQNESFYILKDKILTSNQNSIIPDYKYLDINELKNIITNLEPDSTTKYKDGKMEYTYVIDLLTIKYIDNLDNTFKAIIDYPNNNLEIDFYNINKTSLKFDEEIYKFDYNKEENNEY